jgi:hypothetical protein
MRIKVRDFRELVLSSRMTMKKDRLSVLMAI